MRDNPAVARYWKIRGASRTKMQLNQGTERDVHTFPRPFYVRCETLVFVLVERLFPSAMGCSFHPNHTLISCLTNLPSRAPGLTFYFFLFFGLSHTSPRWIKPGFFHYALTSNQYHPEIFSWTATMRSTSLPSSQKASSDSCPFASVARALDSLTAEASTYIAVGSVTLVYQVIPARQRAARRKHELLSIQTSQSTSSSSGIQLGSE